MCMNCKGKTQAGIKKNPFTSSAKSATSKPSGAVRFGTPKIKASFITATKKR